MATPITFTAAFLAASLISYVEFSNIYLIQKIGFESTECIKVRGYESSYIHNLINKQIQLTPNQLIIYQKCPRF